MPSLEPFDAFAWQKNRQRSFYRFLALDERLARYALYDLGQKRRNRAHRIVCIDAAVVEQAIDNGIERLHPDPLRSMIPEDVKACHIAQRDKNWSRVQRLFGVEGEDDTPMAPPPGHRHEDIFFDPQWRARRVREEAKRQGVLSSQLYRWFWTCVRYGGDRIAMTPGFYRSGAAGEPKAMLEDADKSGRKSSEYYDDPTTYHPRNRTGPWVHCRIMSQIIATIVKSPDKARQRFNEGVNEMADEFIGEYCFVSARAAAVKRGCIAAARIPERYTIVRHTESILQRIGAELVRVLPPWRPPPEGRATDTALGAEIIADMDGTEFPFIHIVTANRDRTEFRDIGSVRTALGVVRGSDYPLGWYVTTGPEDMRTYKYCLVSMFCDKTRHLQELGFKALPEGLTSGNVDRVVVDGGAGSAKSHVIWLLKSLYVNVAKVRPYHPRGKGHVEGTNKRAKDGFLAKLAVTKELRARVTAIMREREAREPSTSRYRKICRSGKGRPEKSVIYMEAIDFERVLVEVLNDLALSWREAPRAESLDAYVHGEPLTRLAAFRRQQHDRRGDRAYRRTEDEIRCAIFKKELKERNLCNGRFSMSRNLEYGIDRDAQALSPELQELWDYEQMNGGPGKTVYVSVCPDIWGNFALWHLPDGRWLRIPPTEPTRRRCGECAQRYELERQRIHWINEKKRHKKRRSRSHSKKNLSAAAALEAAKIKRSAGLIPSETSHPRSPAAKRALIEQRTTEATRDAAAAGVPPLAPAKALSAFKPRHGGGGAVDLETLRSVLRTPKKT
ncbi:hypothetical protein [Cupriavidus basilensis]